MQKRQKIEAESLEGLILCHTKELGLYSVNHWESLTDFMQGLKGQMCSLVGAFCQLCGE